MADGRREPAWRSDDAGYGRCPETPADGHSIFPLLAGAMATPALLPNARVRSTAISLRWLNSTPISRSSRIRRFQLNRFQNLSLPQEPSGPLNISVGGLGTPGHLLAEAFKLQTGVRATIVPYKQMQQRVADLLGGTTHFGFYPTPMVASLITTGKLRALAVTASKRIAALKDIPTIAEQGFPELAAEDS